uniref:Cell wall protein-like n=1 Tax=Oryza sativa subsp. japonica TaxID=39947 RepID=Q5Z7Y5_ORYSJ|nr:cell wall protein-like [Oryza sativa Japonica Group]
MTTTMPLGSAVVGSPRRADPLQAGLGHDDDDCRNDDDDPPPADLGHADPLPACLGRLCRLDRAPAGRAVASSSVAATSSTPACPPFRAVTAGGAFPPSPFSFLRAGRLQPPLPPRRSAVRPRRLLPRPRSHLLSLGQPSVSRGKHRRRVLAGKTVALPPLFHLWPPLSRFPCAGRRRHHLPRLRDAALHPGCSSVSPERRRRAGLSILFVAGVLSAAPSSSPAPAAGCPRRLLAGPGRRRRRPPVVPGRRGVRPSVKPFSSVIRVRQVCRCSPVVVFVLGSASSSLVPAASRLRPRIAAEAVPSPFVSVVPVSLRRARSSLSFPRLVAWCFACVPRVAFVVPEVPEAWFAVVAEGSEGRSLRARQ